ncbi:hypothetical protein AAG906_000008 [Vitis piasezkii]
MSRDNRHASSWLIGESIRETYQGVADIRKQYGVQISYDKAWRARELALDSIRESHEESYNTLPSYCYVLEQKILYLGTLFIAACKDGNNRIYPLAFGTGDSENDASWEWFLQKLHDALGHIDDLFVILDRHGSIEKAYIKYFPMRDKVQESAIHKLFHDAAHAYRVSEFNFIFGQLEMIDPRAARYLMDIGVDRWARSYSTRKRYNIMTTGIVESLNVVLKNARDLPVLQLVEELRNLLQKWFMTRQQQAMSTSTELTMWADGELRSRYNMSATYLVEPINSKECNTLVHAHVDNLILIIFHVHMLFFACRFYNISCYTLCSKYFTTKALLSSYSECIYPTGNEIDWVVPNHIRDKVVLPPKTRRPTGRPMKVRIPSVERQRTSRCSRCGQYGHNRKTCK